MPARPRLGRCRGVVAVPGRDVGHQSGDRHLDMDMDMNMGVGVSGSGLANALVQGSGTRRSKRRHAPPGCTPRMASASSINSMGSRKAPCTAWRTCMAPVLLLLVMRRRTRCMLPCQAHTTAVVVVVAAAVACYRHHPWRPIKPIDTAAMLATASR